MRGEPDLVPEMSTTSRPETTDRQRHADYRLCINYCIIPSDRLPLLIK